MAICARRPRSTPFRGTASAPPAEPTVKGYVGQIRVIPLTDGDKTFVEWTSTWVDGEGGVKEFCDSIYQAALKALADNVR